MKKLKEAKRRWFTCRARCEIKKRKHIKNVLTFTTESGSVQVRGGNARPLPGILCLNTDIPGTVAFFERFRSETKRRLPGFSKAPTSKKRGRIKTLRNYYDFESLDYVSPGAALVLAAEFDRVNELSGRGPSSINLDKWNDLVYGTFFHLGFFKLLGFSEAKIRKQEIARPPVLSELVVMAMQKGRNADVLHAAKAVKALFQSIGANNDLAVKLISTIVDAIENVVDHAYKYLPESEKLLVPHKWWIGGSASPIDKTVTVYVYDQGISIPVSLPIVWNNNKVLDAILSKLNLLDWTSKPDAEAIQAAMRLSSTSTGLSNRGRGLHKIKEIIGLLEGGELTILSRRGHYKWRGNQESCFAMESALMGTYVELKAKF